ncbi:glycoside hydrolase family 64 protein [Amycolatopsis pithecellobii]|uniref:Beta-1,3-glucanase n=1 Tax=Amycolatopsis pithecellobii TaxID=664692 RepID=A0A6N7ZCL6_9PSEU|nr:glycoside hydrolase family 64 protein [Amycolatopsis pithecellobii]MTD59446.1 beta-1,3-glucanase [Amycolatopsis pithecellobii]
MLSRRAFLGLSAAALTAPAWPGFVTAAATPATFTLSLVNNSGSGTVYAYVTGTTPDNRLVLLAADGSPYYPSSPSGTLTPLPVDCAIPVGSGRQVSVPRMAGARIYLVTDSKLDFFLNPGPALVHPSFLNTSDPNFGRQWSFAEFTFNDTQLFANISYVDFVALPLGIALSTTSSGSKSVPGLPSGSAAAVASELSAQGSNWGQLAQTSNGRVLRVLSAHHKADQFAGYLDGYLDQVWQKYSGQQLRIDSQNPGLGVFTGTVSGGSLTFDNGESFTKPTTADVWSCDSGPFAITAGASLARKAIIPRLAAALNRTTLLANANQPDGEDPAQFYRNAQTNHYARIVHSRLPDNRGYAFPYDDVTPGPDFSGSVFAGDPEVLTVTVNAF